MLIWEAMQYCMCSERELLQITLHNDVLLFIQVIAKLRLQVKKQSLRKVSTKKSQIMKRKLDSVFLLKTEIRNSRTP